MGALFSSLLETVLCSFDSGDHWIETGIRRGYFPLGKHWEEGDLQYALSILTNATALRLVSLSLVGQSFVVIDNKTEKDGNENDNKSNVKQSHQNNQDDDKDDALTEFLRLVVTRPELETLRLAAGSKLQQEHLVHNVVTAHRPRQYPKLRVECYVHDNDERNVWHELTQLPSCNVLVVKKIEEKTV